MLHEATLFLTSLTSFVFVCFVHAEMSSAALSTTATAPLLRGSASVSPAGSLIDLRGQNKSMGNETGKAEKIEGRFLGGSGGLLAGSYGG